MTCSRRHSVLCNLRNRAVTCGATWSSSLCLENTLKCHVSWFELSYVLEPREATTAGYLEWGRWCSLLAPQGLVSATVPCAPQQAQGTGSVEPAQGSLDAPRSKGTALARVK